MSKLKPVDFWINNKNLSHLTPPGDRSPEVDLEGALKKAIKGSVLEFGCGDGRLSGYFSKNKYIGYDINPKAVERAKENNPGYKYINLLEEFKKPKDTVLAYTVLLHIPDDEIQEVIELFKRFKKVVIGEITGRKWRRDGNPPVFNREIKDYEELLGVEAKIIKVPYPRYDCDLDLMVFEL